MLRISVVTAGEDALRMNAAIRSIVRVATFNGLEILGIEKELAGFIEDLVRAWRMLTIRTDHENKKKVENTQKLILGFSFDYKGDFDIGTVFHDVVLFYFRCAPLHINRLDAPNRLGSFCNCILCGVFPTFR